MGTSKGYGGPPNHLVPSWLSSGSAGDGGDDGGANGDGLGNGDESGDPPAGGDVGLTGARNAFTRFSKTGSTSSLAAAMASYGGRTGRGGGGGGGASHRAALRMGASRGTGARLLGVLRDFQQAGPGEVLRRLNLDGMASLPASEVFIAMLEFLCPPGGAVDEAISRQAMLEAIAELNGSDEPEFGALEPDQLREFFLDFIVRSIEGRVIADIGAKGLLAASDVESLETAYGQLHDFVDGNCRMHVSGLLTGVDDLSDRELIGRIDEVYEAAFSLIADAGEDSR